MKRSWAAITCPVSRGGSEALAELRPRKHRDEKPFASLVVDIAAVSELCEGGDKEEALLHTRATPWSCCGHSGKCLPGRGNAHREESLGLA